MASKSKGVTGNTCTICGEWADLVCPCQTTRYCSKECQAVDWKQRGHKAACKKIRAEREEEAKRGEAPTPLSSPKPERPVFYGPAERTHADEVRARIKAEHEAARVKREANPEPETEAISQRFGKACPICLVDWDVNEISGMQSCCCRLVCQECFRRILRSETCPLCREPCPKSPKEGLDRIRRHADKDIPEAILTLGDTYRYGHFGLVPSAKKAEKLYERAAKLGDVQAMVSLGYLYRDGATGVKLDKKKARKFFRLVSDRGEVRGHYELARILDEAGNFCEAARLLGLAAAQGYTEAQHHLGICHYLGRGVPRDLKEAKRLFRLAAAKGYEDAMRWLRDLETPI